MNKSTFEILRFANYGDGLIPNKDLAIALSTSPILSKYFPNNWINSSMGWLLPSCIPRHSPELIRLFKHHQSNDDWRIDEVTTNAYVVVVDNEGYEHIVTDDDIVIYEDIKPLTEEDLDKPSTVPKLATSLLDDCVHAGLTGTESYRRSLDGGGIVNYAPLTMWATIHNVSLFLSYRELGYQVGDYYA